MLRASWTILPTGPRAVSVARVAARLVLSARGVGVGDPDSFARLEPVIAELVSNGVRHAGGCDRLELAFDGACLTVGAVDHGADDPELKAHGPPDAGRGLAIVDAMSASWGWHRFPGGKCVWARLDSGPTRHRR
ncbi:ATP-binding protein [Virgisporangium ochraceum]|uniref:Histidine kinase/HSP90-like ATPase domain-containing protein n=1 Tax=Virgisporangium ochraceum TaxID=65505 RepID=A0A8J4A378_9ACTN|nr:ATP-binding protein [Virgisporangium ochraceum]GIJ73035.1 hypothetical protein Voc01_079520 [Virgisporangium ochraceum]